MLWQDDLSVVVPTVVPVVAAGNDGERSGCSAVRLPILRECGGDRGSPGAYTRDLTGGIDRGFGGIAHSPHEIRVLENGIRIGGP